MISSQRSFQSEIQDKNFLIGLVNILYYPTITNLMRAPQAQANLIYSYKHKCTPKGVGQR